MSVPMSAPFLKAQYDYARSALPNAPVVPHVEKKARAVTARRALSKVLYRLADQVSPGRDEHDLAA
ncbi:hypothetical protein [Actinocorallia longicatena]|uniref:Uncharacterized protein n=1 Tax=Actinocorallia longicatena TaxID=111803 RepID=A0ABP6Q748_9ACTN